MAGQLAGRVALITGASRGLGAAVAERFAAEGAHVILAARTTGGLEEVDDRIQKVGGSATLVPLDLRKPEFILPLAQTIADRWGHLDCLVLNAAMLGYLSPVSHLDPKAWNETIATNLSANFHLLRAMDPLLRRAQAGRVITVTSGAAQSPSAYWGAYAASKAALEALVLSYAQEVAKTNIKVNLIDPGIFQSRLRAEAFPAEDTHKLPTPESLTGSFVDLASPRCTDHGALIKAAPTTTRKRAAQ